LKSLRKKKTGKIDNISVWDTGNRFVIVFKRLITTQHFKTLEPQCLRLPLYTIYCIKYRYIIITTTFFTIIIFLVSRTSPWCSCFTARMLTRHKVHAAWLICFLLIDLWPTAVRSLIVYIWIFRFRVRISMLCY